MTGRNPELLIRLEKKMFGNEELGKIFLLIKQFYVNHGSFPGWDVLRSIVAQKSTTQDKARAIIALLDQIQERDVTGLTDDMLACELEETGQCRGILDSLLELAKAAEGKDLAAVKALYRKGYEEAFLTREDGALADANMFNMAGKMIKFNFNSTGLPPLDERGGLIEGGLFCIAGESKAGKSVLAIQLAVHNYIHHHESCAYFTYEQGKKEIRARIMASLSGIDVGNISINKLTREERIKLRLTELRFLFVDDQAMAGFCAEHTRDGLTQAEQEADDEAFFSLARGTFTKLDKDFLIFDEPFDWDTLFIKMELLRTTKGISFFCIDYPFLVPRGASDKELAGWEYSLLQSRKLKHFARTHTAHGTPTRVGVLAQYDAKADSLRYVKGLVNDLDMLIKISQDAEDREMGTVTCSHGGIYRNFLSVPGKPALEDFKLLREFAYSRFAYMAF